MCIILQLYLSVNLSDALIYIALQYITTGKPCLSKNQIQSVLIIYDS